MIKPDHPSAGVSRGGRDSRSEQAASSSSDPVTTTQTFAPPEARPPVASPIRVMKFGGTSVGSAARIRRVVGLVADARANSTPVVVVSAVNGTTDRLAEVAELAGRGDVGHESVTREIAEMHRELLHALAPTDEAPGLALRLDAAMDDLRRLARGVQLLGECTLRTRDWMLSFGELLSSMLVAACMRSHGVAAVDVDARELLRTDTRFGGARVDRQRSRKLVRARLPGDAGIPVVTGFIASTANGETTTLGRGASDFTATLLGSMLGAEEVEIWTDVDGVLTADPEAVPEAAPIREITYAELLELAHFGARVICPPAVEPARSAGIRLRIRSTLDPSLPGTLVVTSVRRDPLRPVRGISATRDVALIRLAGVETVGVTEASQRIFRALRVADVDSLLFTQDSGAHALSLAVRGADAERARAALGTEFRRERESRLVRDPTVEQGFSILAVVGEGMRYTPGVSGKLFSALGAARVNVHAIAQGSSERNISWVVNAGQEGVALRTVHRAFFSPPDELEPVRILLFGAGVVGGAFLDQLAANGEDAMRPHGVQPVLVGIANSRRAAIDLEGLVAGRWRSHLEGGRGDPDQAFDAVWTGDPLVIVDCTASADVSARYAEYLRAGAAVVTANKIALSGPTGEYTRLMRLAGRGGGLHHGATVGAGLPMVGIIAELRRSGDTVLSLEGTLSGTLTFLMDQLSRGRRFSSAVEEARRRGISEPDPREDLGLRDVVRKLVILARTAGIRIEPSDVDVEPILPEDLLQPGPVRDFIERLPEVDAAMAERTRAATAQGGRLVCLARVAQGAASVRLEVVPAEQPVARTRGTENLLVVRSRWYADHPMVIQGPGAGPEVTAAGLMTDLVAAAGRVAGRALLRGAQGRESDPLTHGAEGNRPSRWKMP